MTKPQLIVYPTRDTEQAKRLFTLLLGAQPYIDTPYYVGYRTDGREVGLDPNGPRGGPIAY